MFYNNEKINAVAEAVKKIMEVPVVVEPAVKQTAHVPFEPLEEDMHKPLLPKQKEIQKSIDSKSKHQMPSKIQAGTLAAKNKLNKEENEQVDEAGNYTNISSVASNKVAPGMTSAMHKAAAARYKADADAAHTKNQPHERDWANGMADKHLQYAKELAKEEKTFKDRLIEGMKQKENPEELLPDLEEEMSDSQKKKREEIVMSMKDRTSYFKKKYGAKWKNVMYATATKQAMGEQIIWDDYVVEAEDHDDEEEDEKQMKAHNADPDSHKPAIKKMVKKDCLKSEEVEQIDELKASTLRSYVNKRQSSDKESGKGAEIALAMTKAKGKPPFPGMKDAKVHATKEEVDQYDEEEHAGHLGHAARQAAKSGKKVFTLGGKTFPVKVKAVKENNESHTHAAHYEDSKTGEWSGMKLMVAKDDKDAIEQAHKNCEDGCRLSKVERHIPVKEEVEQVDEISTNDVSEASKRDVAVRKFMSHDPEAGERILAMGKKEKETEKAFKSGKAEINRLKKMGEEVEQVDEISTKLANRYFSKASKQSQKRGAKDRDAGMAMAYKKVQGRHANVPTTDRRNQQELLPAREEVVFEASEQDIDDKDITTDTLGGRVADGKVNSFKNFKVKLKSDREYQRAPDDKDSIPASTAARASITAKKWNPPSNVKTEEVELDEKKKSHMLVIPKKPDPKTGRKDVKKIPAHMWAQMKDTHYQAEEVELEEGKDPSMDAGVGSEASFVQNANTSSNPSPKHTPISYAKNLAHKAMQKIKADLGHK
jgi:hypothetical protein